MSLQAETRSLFTSIRVTLAISGIVALLAGIALLVWPTKTLAVVTMIFASYLIIAGLVYIGLAVFSAKKGGWSRVGHIVLGLLYIAAGVIAFANLESAKVTLALVVVIFIGISWVVDGFVALTLLGQDGSRVWTLLYAVLSIVAGIFVMFSPLVAGFMFWLMFGISLVMLGVVQIVRAITLGKDEKATLSTLQSDPSAV